jgi:hypothetical protein
MCFFSSRVLIFISKRLQSQAQFSWLVNQDVLQIFHKVSELSNQHNQLHPNTTSLEQKP